MISTRKNKMRTSGQNIKLVSGLIPANHHPDSPGSLVVSEYPVAASRPFWKGFLRLSFVSCPIALYPAVSAAERISFRQVNKRTGHRLRHQLVDSVTGETVEATDKGRGYEMAQGLPVVSR